MNAVEILARVLVVEAVVEEEEVGMVGEEETGMVEIHTKEGPEEEIHTEEGLEEEEAGVTVAQIMVVAIDMNPTMEVDVHQAEDGVVIKTMVVDVMEVAVHKERAGMNGKGFKFLASCLCEWELHWICLKIILLFCMSICVV